jgi:outer membrane protein assembly factor BamB
VDGKAYALGATGVASCLDARLAKCSGRSNTVETCGAKIPTWGFAASPVIDGERVLLHVGAKDGSVIALDKKQRQGSVAWRA